MKLALCIFNYFPYGGMQRDFLRIALLLAKQYSVEVLTTAWQGEIPASLSVNKIAVLGLTNHWRMQDFARKALKKARQLSCKLVVGFNKMPGLDIYFAADNCYVATVKQKHGLCYRLTSRYRIYQALEKSVFASNSKTKILLLAAQQKKAYQQIYHTAEEQFYWLPTEFNRLNHPYLADKTVAQKIRLMHGIESTDYIVLMVCAAFKTKGVDRALRAFSKLHHELLAKTHLLIIGDDKSGPFLRLAKRLRIETHVQFLGAKKNVLEYMCAADLFLHPARQEAAGKVILEAMSCGLPVLTTAECGYAEHVIKANSGIVVTNCDLNTEVLRNLITWMLNTSLANKIAWKEQALNYVASYPNADLATEAMHVIQNAINDDGKNS